MEVSNVKVPRRDSQFVDKIAGHSQHLLLMMPEMLHNQLVVSFLLPLHSSSCLPLCAKVFAFNFSSDPQNARFDFDEVCCLQDASDVLLRRSNQCDCIVAKLLLKG